MLCGGDKDAAGCLLDAEFFKIQHQVASLTLESITTFTRHNAFLEKRSIKNFQKNRRSQSGGFIFEFIFPRGSRVRQAMREADARASCARW